MQPNKMLIPGRDYYVETVLGSYLCELVEVVGPYAIVGKRNVYVGNTGRHHLFFQGHRDNDGNLGDENCELEPHPPKMLKMYVFVGIEEWPHGIPKEPK